jgi:gamma-glutamylcyclotransferase (GGCT)/AIG2-like uncharacterized protein YtfP
MNEGIGDGSELLVFVYGTLKPGGRYHRRYCGRALAQAVPALVKGRLYHFAQWGYPAMTVGEDWVRGYLLRFCGSAEVCQAILRGLDTLEGIASDSGESEASVDDDGYQRCWQAVFSLGYEPLPAAWVYRMTDEQVAQFGGVYLPGGDWPVSG